MELAVSIVSHSPDERLLRATLDSLCMALSRARAETDLECCRLYLIDNGPADARSLLDAVLEDLPDISSGLSATLISGHGNIGYGAGHNLAIRRADSPYHLVLNPDVELQADALCQALRFMARYPDTGLLAPAVRDVAGEYQYLCRRYPGVVDLGLRGFAPPWLQRRFSRRLHHYEMRDVIGPSRVIRDVPLASGCFMLLRRSALAQTGGFDAGFFLYFEDYDLSLRIARVARIAYVPRVRIIHHGGQAARKGWRHVGHFVRSAARFYRKHGWAW